MEKIRGARTGRVVTAGMAVVVLLVGTGLLLYSLFGGGEPASDIPEAVPERGEPTPGGPPEA